MSYFTSKSLDYSVLNVKTTYASHELKSKGTAILSKKLDKGSIIPNYS